MKSEARLSRLTVLTCPAAGATSPCHNVQVRRSDHIQDSIKQKLLKLRRTCISTSDIAMASCCKLLNRGWPSERHLRSKVAKYNSPCAIVQAVMVAWSTCVEPALDSFAPSVHSDGPLYNAGSHAARSHPAKSDMRWTKWTNKATDQSPMPSGLLQPPCGVEGALLLSDEIFDYFKINGIATGRKCPVSE